MFVLALDGRAVERPPQSYLSMGPDDRLYVSSGTQETRQILHGSSVSTAFHTMYPSLTSLFNTTG